MNRIFEVDEMLRIGLDWAGFDASRQRTVNRDANVRRFQSCYFGSSPLVCSAIWKDLVTSDIQEARIHPGTSATLDKFLLTLYFLKAILPLREPWLAVILLPVGQQEEIGIIRYLQILVIARE